MRMIVGLGNPGREYAETRHNVGFMVVNELIRRNSATAMRLRFRAEITEYFFGGEKIVLLAPQTFMNLSGASVQQALNWYRLAHDQMLVISDDLDLPFGQLRFRSTGSAGGHNGLKSIIQDTGSTDFPRLRIGVGRGPSTAVAHVLSRFRPEEAAELPDITSRAADMAELWIREGIIAAMNATNAKPLKVELPKLEAE